MPLLPIPATRTRLSVSYSMFVTAQDGQRHKVGMFRSLTPSERRAVENVFALDADLSGQPFEAIPQLTVDKSIRYDSLTLYTQNLLEAIINTGQRIESLADFNIPFDIEMQLTQPSGAIKTKKYVNCWITSYEETIQTSNIIVSATGDIRYERIDYPAA